MIILTIVKNKLKKKKIVIDENYIKVCGYRLYLKKVEKEKIELLFNNSPDLFYRKLSYAYSLGVSNKWINELENIDYLDIIKNNGELENIIINKGGKNESNKWFFKRKRN